MSLWAVGMTGARPAQGTATTTDGDLVRTFERASLWAVGMTGARPAQGAATTTDGDYGYSLLEYTHIL